MRPLPGGVFFCVELAGSLCGSFCLVSSPPTLGRAFSLISLEGVFSVFRSSVIYPYGRRPHVCIFGVPEKCIPQSYMPPPRCELFRLSMGRDLHLYILRIQLEHSHTTDTLHLFTIPNGDRGAPPGLHSLRRYLHSSL